MEAAPAVSTSGFNPSSHVAICSDRRFTSMDRAMAEKLLPSSCSKRMPGGVKVLISLADYLLHHRTS